MPTIRALLIIIDSICSVALYLIGALIIKPQVPLAVAADCCN